MRVTKLGRLGEIAIGVGAILAATTPASMAEGLRFEVAAPLGIAELGGERGGQLQVAGNNNLTMQANSTQDMKAVTKENQVNAGGDLQMTAGMLTIGGEGMGQIHGMTNIVANSAPQASVQGVMALTIVFGGAP